MWRSLYPVRSGGAPPTPTDANDYRRTSYTYDADEQGHRRHRQRRFREDPIEIGAPTYNASTNTWTVTPSTASSLSSTTNYDAFGDVWQSIDADGNTTYAFYNAVGQKIAAVDGDGYVAGYTLDAFWNVATQTQYATALNGATIAAFTALTDNAPTLPTGTGNDRAATFTYDNDGNLLKGQSIAGAAVSTISGLTVSTVSGASKISYAYNALGEVATQTQATTDATKYTYTAAGRLATITSPSFTDAAGEPTRRNRFYTYNGLGEVTSIASGQKNAPTRTTSNTYDAIGRKTSLTDASGFTQFYSYDNDGNLLTASYVRMNSSDTQKIDHAEREHRQREGRLHLRRRERAANPVDVGLEQVHGVESRAIPTSTTVDTANLRYDVYGDVTGKGINGTSTRRPCSTTAPGAWWRATGRPGRPDLLSLRRRRPDAETATLSSAGTSFYTAGVVDTLAQALVLGTTYGGSYVSGIELTLTQYDARGQATAVGQPFQQVSSAAPTSANTYTSKATYDAFGDVTTSTNNLGYTTTNTGYDTLGELTKSVAPSVKLYSAANPTGYRPRPPHAALLRRQRPPCRHGGRERQLHDPDAARRHRIQRLASRHRRAVPARPDQPQLRLQRLRRPDQANRPTKPRHHQDLRWHGPAADPDPAAGHHQRRRRADRLLRLRRPRPADRPDQLATQRRLHGRHVHVEGARRSHRRQADHRLRQPGPHRRHRRRDANLRDHLRLQLVGHADDERHGGGQRRGDVSAGWTRGPEAVPGGAAPPTSSWRPRPAVRRRRSAARPRSPTSSAIPWARPTSAATPTPSTYGNAAGWQTAQTNSLGQNIQVAYYNTGRDATFTSNIRAIARHHHLRLRRHSRQHRLGEQHLLLPDQLLHRPAAAAPVVYENETATYNAMGWVTAISDQGYTNAHPMSVTYGLRRQRQHGDDHLVVHDPGRQRHNEFHDDHAGHLLELL